MPSLPTQKSLKNEGSLSTYKGNMNETLDKHGVIILPQTRFQKMKPQKKILI